MIWDPVRFNDTLVDNPLNLLAVVAAAALVVVLVAFGTGLVLVRPRRNVALLAWLGVATLTPAPALLGLGAYVGRNDARYVMATCDEAWPECADPIRARTTAIDREFLGCNACTSTALSAGLLLLLPLVIRARVRRPD